MRRQSSQVFDPDTPTLAPSQATNLRFQSIRFKLVAIVALPLLIALILAAAWLNNTYTTYSEMELLKQLTLLEIHIGSYVHEIQKERGATNVFIESNGKRFQTELANQWLATNKTKDQLESSIAEYQAFHLSEHLKEALANILTSLETINTHRDKVEQLKISATESTTFYTHHIEIFLHTISGEIKEIKNAKQALAMSAYAHFLHGKERAGGERALMSTVLVADQFEPNGFMEFRSLITAQDTFFSNFLEFATPHQVAYFKETVSGPTVDEVQRMRDIVSERIHSRPKLLTMEAHFNLVQTWQWLTDISATQSLDGLDDGFDKAEAYAILFRENLHELLTFTPDAQVRIEELLVSFETFYSKGKWMAEQYIKGGPALGNLAMEDFDTSAEDILAKIEDIKVDMSERSGFGIDPGHWFNTITQKLDLMKQVEDKLTADMLNNVSAMSLSTSKAFVLVSFLTVFTTLGVLTVVYLYSNRIALPIVQLSHNAKRITQGHLNQTFNIDATGEIGELATCFESMVQSLNKTMQDMDVAMREAESANLAKSQFLANMSHEIRTPMNSVLGFADILLTTKLSNEQDQYVTTLRQTGQSLLNIINDILDISKIEAGKMTFESIPCDMRQIVEDVANVVSPNINTPTVQLEVRIDPQLPPMVLTDPTRVRQILLNLVGNAVKFTQQGEILIQLEVLNPQDRQLDIKCSVHDTGIGIAEDKLAHLFDEFTQADESTTREFGGTGLGLSISYHMVELMGGALQVTSQLGAGSCFAFTVHAETCDAPLLSHEKDDLNQQPISIQRVLLVDDNKVNQMVAIKMLKFLNLDVDIANNGQEAVLAVRQNHYDLIFMDCSMPVMDGYEATRQIRAEESKDAPNTIIAMTANAMAEDKAKCLAAGMDDFTTKPISINKLKEVCLLWGKRKPQELVSSIHPPLR